MTTRACSPRNIVGGPGFNKTVWLPAAGEEMAEGQEGSREIT